MNDEIGSEAPEILVLAEDPRAWEAVSTRPDDESVQRYANVRTFLSRWHRWVCDHYPIVHTEDYTDVELPDGRIIRAYGRIIAGDGTDYTDEHLR
jgi:hypothetical protein